MEEFKRLLKRLAEEDREFLRGVLLEAIGDSGAEELVETLLRSPRARARLAAELAAMITIPLNVATKEDIKMLETKMATKEDLRALEARMDVWSPPPLHWVFAGWRDKATGTVYNYPQMPVVVASTTFEAVWSLDPVPLVAVGGGAAGAAFLVWFIRRRRLAKLTAEVEKL